MEKEYFTIKEYAELKGVSYHAIYKKLNTTLKPFVIEVKGHKVLKKEALEDSFNPQDFNVKEKLFNVKEKNEVPSSSTIEDELRHIIARNEELIDSLREEVKEKDARLQQMSDKIVDILETNQRLLENNQSLQLNYQLLLGVGQDKQNEEVDIQGARVVEESENTTEEPPKKKGLFSRLFGL